MHSLQAPKGEFGCRGYAERNGSRITAVAAAEGAEGDGISWLGLGQAIVDRADRVLRRLTSGIPLSRLCLLQISFIGIKFKP